MNKFIKIFTATVGLAVTSTALILSCIKAKKPDKNKNIDLSNMELVFEDNFDGELDKNTWDTSCETPKRRGGYWAPEQCFTKDGKLIIRTNTKKTVRMVQAGTQAPVVQEISKILNTDILRSVAKFLQHKVYGVHFG